MIREQLTTELVPLLGFEFGQRVKQINDLIIGVQGLSFIMGGSGHG